MHVCLLHLLFVTSLGSELLLLEICCKQPLPCMVACFIASVTLCLDVLQLSEALQQEAKQQAAAAEARATVLQVPPYTLHSLSSPPPAPFAPPSLTLC